MCAYCIFVLFVYCLLFVQYFDTVGWVFWPVKTVAHITYTVLAETLNPAPSINLMYFILYSFYFLWQQIEVRNCQLVYYLCERSMKPLMSVETVGRAINTLLSITHVLAYSQSVSLGRVAVRIQVW